MINELVGRARRRYLYNEMLAQGAWAGSAAMAAVIILLLTGTQLLDWRWLVILPLATLAVGTWRTLRRVPRPYAVAQVIDRRLHLADSLSTALFFYSPGRNAAPEVCEWQRAQAERLCAGINVRDAVPFTMPRAVYSMAALGVAATSLFALRYGLDRRLDLDKPLARIIQQAFGLEQQQLAALEKKQEPRRKTPATKELEGLSLQDQLPDAGQPNTADNAFDTTAASENQKKMPEQRGIQVKSSGEQSGEDSEATDEMADSSTGGNDNGQQGKNGQNQNGKESAGKQSPEGADGNNSSLMAKFKEAMQNILSRMKQQPSGTAGGPKQQASNAQNGKQGKPQQGQGEANRQGQQQSGGQETNSQEGQPGSESQTAQNAMGRGQGQGGEENPSKQPGSGIGKQDGSKDVKLAEQLAAMGKISEIIGKRAAHVSGEVTVEVQNSSQQLATPYSKRTATHGETTAEINRDEVPVALQPYVQQYFEQVRRQGAEADAKSKRQ
jgi:hypothetical protein